MEKVYIMDCFKSSVNKNCKTDIVRKAMIQSDTPENIEQYTSSHNETGKLKKEQNRHLKV